jgi:hypothetical protein
VLTSTGLKHLREKKKKGNQLVETQQKNINKKNKTRQVEMINAYVLISLNTPVTQTYCVAALTSKGHQIDTLAVVAEGSITSSAIKAVVEKENEKQRRQQSN